MSKHLAITLTTEVNPSGNETSNIPLGNKNHCEFLTHDHLYGRIAPDPEFL